MAVYIKKTKNPTETSINKYVAKVGFSLRGEEIIEYLDIEEILPLKKDNIVVDYIGGMYSLFDYMDIEHPEYDYPEELNAFYGRKIKPGVMADIFNDDGTIKNVFIKPRLETKIFTGKVIKKQADLIGINVDMNYPIWISEVVEIVAEWRAFIIDKEIIGIQKYKGKYGVVYDYDVVEKAVKAWDNSPAAYVLDIGLTKSGETVVVEINDGFSVGFYGLEPCKAAMFLERRWKELTADYFNKNNQ